MHFAFFGQPAALYSEARPFEEVVEFRPVCWAESRSTSAREKFATTLAGNNDDWQNVPVS